MSEILQVFLLIAAIIIIIVGGSLLFFLWRVFAIFTAAERLLSETKALSILKKALGVGKRVLDRKDT